jgi:16S rRNA A1518/A1519 N6-dimethyltransferase RsmA/KsgA/DIM1 with predicted DNA glycosylase/AP lyase activity
VLDDELHRLANTADDQYFLTDPTKLNLLVSAAQITPEDHVVEIGAGAGTVAAFIPQCASLTLIELDERMIPILTTKFPTARILHGDALSLLPELECDVLLSNLPGNLTPLLLAQLPSLACRIAIAAVSAASSADFLAADFDIDKVATLELGDFTPPQPRSSELVSIARRGAAGLIAG